MDALDYGIPRPKNFGDQWGLTRPRNFSVREAGPSRESYCIELFLSVLWLFYPRTLGKTWPDPVLRGFPGNHQGLDSGSCLSVVPFY